MIPWLHPSTPFPPLERALTEPNGLLAAGDDLSLPRLLEAYRHGIFPWFNEGEPVLWWSPDPRMVLFPEEFKVSRSLKKTLARADYVVRVDTAFTRVMRACAEPRDEHGGTWISEPMIAAYGALHEAGYAHSFETWMDGADGEELVGGLYGVALGRAFFGESMFTRKTDASKIALAHLVATLKQHDFGVIDCQMKTAHLASLGARAIPRGEFSRLLARLTPQSQLFGPWTNHSWPVGSRQSMRAAPGHELFPSPPAPLMEPLANRPGGETTPARSLAIPEGEGSFESRYRDFHGKP